MKQRNTITLILLCVAVVVSAQNYSPCYKEKYDQGVTLYKKGDFNGAKAKFVAAKGCPMPNKKQADEWIGKCIAEINKQAEEKRIAEEKAKEAKQKADAAAAEAKRKSEAEAAKAAEAKRKAEEEKRKEEAELKRKAETQALAKTYSVNGVSFTMIYVEGGTFTMGNTYDEHRVTVSDFCIGETEVTQELWQAVMRSNPSVFFGSNLPVEYVSWIDCQVFIRKLNDLTGKTFRLPTEAEWEYAARGGKHHNGNKYAGSNNIGKVAWYLSNSGDHYLSGDDGWRKREKNNCKPHPVKTREPNELGLYDMSGNVEEWCFDYYDYKNQNSNTLQINPTGPSSGTNRVSRGGSWLSGEGDCVVTKRGGTYPDDRWDNRGFRIVVVP